MSSTVENLAHSFNQLNFSTRHQSWLETTANQRNHGHTLRILSSDDEDSENDEEVGYSSEESEDEIFVRRSMPYGSENKISTPQIDKLKSKLPLPSDDEDEDDEEEEEEDDDDENEAILPRNKMPLIKPETKGTSNGNRPPAVFPSESRNSFQRQQSDGGSSSSNSNNQTPSYFTLNDNFATNDDNEDNEVIGQHLKYPISSNFDAPPKSNAMHQFQQYQQQQQQQQQMALYQYSLQQQQQQQQQLQQQQQQQQYNHHFTIQQKHSPPQQPQQPQLRMATMSGMELLIQREQEKAEQKRQKPKMNPGKVKIEGLLGRLPEAGSHNINFQHVQQQHQLQQQQQQQQQQQLQFIPNNLASPTPNNKSYKGKKHRAQVYQNNSLMAAIPQQQQQQQQQMALGYSPSMYDYYTNGRSSVPPPPPTLYQQQQQVQSFYQSPISASNGNLYMMTNTLPYQQNRPGSTLNSSQQYKQHQRFSGNPNEYTI